MEPRTTAAEKPGASGGVAHVASLDGLRAVAVGLVMGVNAGVPGLSLGGFGVDLFFVLSGFLITTLLLKEHQRTGRISLPRFWGRRFLRLMPAYWLYVGAITLAILVPGTATSVGGWTPGWFVASLWGYFVNYAPDEGVWGHHFLTGHLWSLSVEEQFYFFWPVVVALAVGSPRLAWFALALAGGVFVYRFSATDWELDRLLYTRGLAILLGCTAALACWGDRPPLRDRLAVRPYTRAALAAAAVLLFVASAALLDGHNPREYFWAQRYLQPVFAVLFTGIVAALWYGPAGPLTRALSWGPLVYFGQISYGVYLYNPLAQEAVWRWLLADVEHWPRWPKFGLRLAAFFALTLALASASYWAWERPFLRWKDRLR